ncbi:host specificity factor TipJ family phage tail protein [Methylobacterium sp. Leaf85]|uniref:host specificity factor TipJ family phage tail protein n=1 Tax=Methylobacterium sp. Leaf85 TaxID=1736241 RepID=UPI0006F56046|nr:host specificity factor TipJ family phage tail protein [Methylobacterium sp. Leaf85]KQO53063.1 hypothetical protein ASF08_19250 [Methylobacterium sp. Leaf85]
MNAPIRAPLQGELLGRADTITVIASLHPLSPSRDIHTLPAGLSIREIVDIAVSQSAHGRYAGALSAWVETDPVPLALWNAVRIKSGTRVVLRAVPQGSGSSVLKSLAMLAVAVISAFVAPYLTPIIGATAATFAAAAVAVAGSLLINALFPVDTQKNKGTVYSIAGNQNLATKYEPIPFLQGRMRVYPRYAASAYTEIVGDDQYLTVMFELGYGPLDITDLKIGDTPISAFREVEVEIGYGYPDDPPSKLYPSQVIQTDYNIELKAVDGPTVRATSENCTGWSVDVVAPNGISKTKKDGTMVSFDVDLLVEQSVAYAEDWQPVQTVRFSGAKNQTMRRKVERTAPDGQYDIRLRRLSADTDDLPNIVSGTGFSALRSYRNRPPVSFKKPSAKITLKIKATSQLSGMIDNFNVVATKRGKAWDGAAWQPDLPSQWPADALIRLLQGDAIARPVADKRIDWPTIQAWHANCVLNGWKYNKVHVERRGIRATAQDICSAGRAAVVFRDGMWSVVWDDPTAPIVQHFTPRNSRNFRWQRQYKRLPHGLRVKFLNENRGWREDEIVVYREGYDATNATLFEEAEFPGQTDHVLNTKHAYFHLAQLEYRPDEISLDVDIEHVICTRGDRVRVAHSVPSWGLKSGRVIEVAENIVWLDEPVTMVDGKTYCCRFRSVDGSLIRDVVTVAGTSNALLLSGEGEVPEAGELAMFGETGLESVILRVKTIKGAAKLAATLILVADAPEIAEAAGRPIPPIVEPASPLDGKREPSISEIFEDQTYSGAAFTPAATMTWEMARAIPTITRFEVALKAPDDTTFGAAITVAALLRRYTWSGLTAGDYAFRVRAFFADDTVSDWTATSQILAGFTRPPEDVSGLTVSFVGDRAVFGWSGPEKPAARLELRRAAATTGATWDAATVLDSRADGTALSVPYATGTYLAKFVNGGGLYSAATATLVVTGRPAGGRSVAEIYDLAPFEGTHSGTVEEFGAVRLAATAGGALPASGFYQLAGTLDFGSVSTCTLSGSLLAHGLDLSGLIGAGPDIYGVEETAWAAGLEISTTRDAPVSADATWSGWAPFVPGEVTARACRVRVRLGSLGTAITPAIELIGLKAEAAARNEVGNAVPIPAAGAAIVFDAKFIAEPAVVVTGRDFVDGDRAVITARSASGFTLTIRNSAGTGVARTVDFIASGYGRSLS